MQYLNILPTAAQLAHQLPGLTNNLMSVVALCNARCNNSSTQQDVKSLMREKLSSMDGEILPINFWQVKLEDNTRSHHCHTQCTANYPPTHRGNSRNLMNLTCATMTIHKYAKQTVFTNAKTQSNSFLPCMLFLPSFQHMGTGNWQRILQRVACLTIIATVQ